MPVVFVHGVNVRRGPGYDAGVKVKTVLLTSALAGTTIGGHALPAAPAIWFPYWGDLATDFAWQMASLPHGAIEALGGGGSGDARPIVAQVRDALPGKARSEPLLALARADFQNAAETVASYVLERAAVDGEADAAAFAVAIQRYAAANPNPPWLKPLKTDAQLLGRLAMVAEEEHAVEAQGAAGIANLLAAAAQRIKSAVKDAAGAAVDAGGDFASTKLLGWAREPLNGILGRFFGDVFVYLSERDGDGKGGPIGKRILTEIDAARAAGPPGEPLVIIGHSLGGVITFDLLSFYRPDIVVDLLVTVGSQVAHFEEIKRFKTSQKIVGPPNKAATPPNVRRWINVYDRNDIFAYAAMDVFDRVDIDAEYDTRTYVVKSHTAYFDQDRFYGRLRARIGELP